MPARPSARRRRPTVAVAAAAVAVVLPLAACSGDDDPEPTPTPSEREGTPLEALFSEYLKDWSGEDVSRRLAEMEDLVAECMAEQGFEYTPVDYSSLEIDLSAGLDLQVGSAEFAEQYGYGITTDPFTSGTDEITDPNEEYVAAMSDAERDAYLTALYGEAYTAAPAPADDGEAADSETADDEPADDGALEDYDWQAAGCTGRAQHDVVATGIEDDTFAALQDEMVQMMADAAADPRLAQASRDWSVCMLDAGFDGLAQVGDGEAAIAAEVEAARAEVYGTAGGSATLPTDPGAAAREALRRGLTEPSLEAALDEAVAAITPREIEMAVADAGCRAETGYDDVRRSVDTQYQLAFLAEHADEIQSWMAALAADRDDA